MNDWEFTYRGLTVGPNSNFCLIDVDGLEPVDTRLTDNDRAEDHGSFIFGGYLINRSITLHGDIRSADGTPFELLVNQWREAFGIPTRALQELKFKIPDDVEKQVFCIRNKTNIRMDAMYGIGYTEWTANFVTEDPRIFSSQLHSQIITPTAAAGGLDPDVDFDASFGGSSGGQASVTNIGIWNSPPIIRFDGPFESVIVSNITTGKQTLITTSVEDQHWLTVDYSKKTIMHDDEISRYNALSETNEWWAIEPGVQIIQFVATGAGANTKMTLYWRDAWV